MQITGVSRRTFMRLSGAALIGAAVTGTYSYREIHEFVVERVTMVLPRLPEAFNGFTIAQLSDFHYGMYLHEEYFGRVVDTVNALQPDVVVSTGDHVTSFPVRHYGPEMVEPCAAMISRLRAREYRFAIMGNHDASAARLEIPAVFPTHGFPVLRNQAFPIERDGARLWFLGLHSVLSREVNIAKALRGVPNDECKIVAVHEPDYADVSQKYPVDFQISGHTHGGQIAVPRATLLYPPYGRKYRRGLNHAGRMPVYTNRGIGVINLPFRLGSLPEITFYTLQNRATV